MEIFLALLAWALVIPLGICALFAIAFALAQAALLAIMPIAAIDAAMKARRASLPATRHALLGAICAACFVMPYLYLIDKMNGEPMLNEFAKIWHAILQICWAIFLGGAFGLYNLFGDAWGIGANTNYAFTALHLICWAMWAIALIYFKANDGFSADNRELQPTELTRFYRVAPFAGASITVALFATFFWAAVGWPL